MATGTRPNMLLPASDASPLDQAISVLRAIVEPLASLKLTVFLLVGAVLVTWIATLDQTRIDVWELKQKHFHNFLVEVHFRDLLVPKWFPGLQNINGSFFIPSGMTLMVAMLINLAAAHMLRFRIRARGVRLAAGIGVGILAIMMTWMVVYNRYDPNGFQTQPAEWTKLWSWMQVLLLGLSVFAIAGSRMTASKKRMERILLGSFGAIGLGILVLLFALGKGAFIGDSAMRILWQLMQSTIVALVGLSACILLFQRRSGIVLLHLGIAGLMANEIYVTQTNQEQRMQIDEGQTAKTAFDIRSSELVIVDRSDKETDRLIAIPHNRIFEGAELNEPDMPFRIVIDEYYANSETMKANSETRAKNGLGQFFISTERPKVAGAAAGNKSNMASCYVSIYEKGSGDLLGTYLLSQGLYFAYGMDTITVDGTKWEFALRFQTEYKPYDIKLEDVESENYPGTGIAKTYISKIVLSDSEKEITSNHEVSMNNPLRFAGETFYQSGYEKDSAGRESTVLQIVKNRAWMVPYVCCMIVVVGLATQFGLTLLAFIEKRRRMEQSIRDKFANPYASEIPAHSIAGFDNEKGQGGSDQGFESIVIEDPWIKRWLPVFLVGIFALYVGKEYYPAARKPVRNGEMRLDLLGQLPVTYEGRVKPLDSVARNLARGLSNREEIVYKKPGTGTMSEGAQKLLELVESGSETENDYKHEHENDKEPAIRWLADSMYQAAGYYRYQAFRIEDLNVQQALGLKNRKGLKFSLDELEASRPELDKLLVTIDPKNPGSLFEKRLLKVRGLFERFDGIRIPMIDIGEIRELSVLRRLDFASQLSRASRAPMAVPTGDPDPGKAWDSVASIANRQWLADLANDEFETSDPEILAYLITVREYTNPKVAPKMIRGTILSMINNEETLETLKEITGKTGVGDITKALSDLDTFKKIPIEIVDSHTLEVAKKIQKEIEPKEQQIRETVRAQIRDIIGADATRVEAPDNEYASLLLKLGPAYRAGDAETFNTTLEKCLTMVRADPPPGMKPFGVKLESWYNRASPFYLAMAIFLVAFVVTAFGWVFWNRTLNRAATGLLALAFLVLVTGMSARVLISGRPPITNLYTTFLFVATISIVFAVAVEWITRSGVGNLVGSLVGFLTLMWAWTMTISDGDSFTVLVAVLDTQFWLSTHVVCVTMGYVATLVAGMLGVTFIVASMLSPAFDREQRKLLGNVIYGIVCFGLFFSFFGTVLGGLWADDSWGRFWGWDPKENGALMIVLWNAVVLHARWAGLVRARGIAALAVLGNVFTMWSWIAVNEMGVGLHAYSDSEEGKMFYVSIFWSIMIFTAAIAMIPTRYWASYASDAASD